MASKVQKTNIRTNKDNAHKPDSFPQRDTTSWYFFIIPPVLLGIVTALFYWPSRTYEFQFDDIANITKHYHIRHHTFWDLFFSSSRWLSFWLNSIHYQFGKFDPLTYRLANIAQHILIGVMFYVFLLVALKNLKKQSFFKEHAYSLAFLSAALFLLHPVQTQTISYVIQGQMEGLVTFFAMIMILSFYSACRTKSIVLYILFMIMYFTAALGACSSKEIAIVIPVLMLLVDWFFIAQGSLQELKRRWFFHLLSFGCILGCYTYFFKPKFFYSIIGLQWTATNNLGNVVTDKPVDVITPSAFLISEFKVMLHYLWIFVWPFNMSVEYDWVLSASFFAFDCLIPFLVLSALLAFIIFLFIKERDNLIVFAAVWFFVYVLPRSSIVPSSELVADYKTYAASMGWLFLLAASMIACLQIIATKFQHILCVNRPLLWQVPVASIFIICLGITTAQRNTVWRSGLEFWGNMVKNAPGKARVHNNYGVELSQKLKKYEESIPYFERAIAMDPLYSDPHNNLSVVYAFLGKIDLAITEMERSLKINPGYAEGYNNLAAFYLQKKDFEKAEKYINIAIKIRNSYGKAYLNRARIYFEQNKDDLALQDLKTACTQADLDNEFGYKMYGQFALEHKAWEEALFAFNKLCQIAPQDPDAYVGLGHACAGKSQYEQAIVYFDKAFALDPRNGRYAYLLGEIYVKLKNFTRALSYFERINLLQVPQVAINVAQCYEGLGNIKKAQQTYQAVLNLRLPNDLRSSIAASYDCLLHRCQAS